MCECWRTFLFNHSSLHLKEECNCDCQMYACICAQRYLDCMRNLSLTLSVSGDILWPSFILMVSSLLCYAAFSNRKWSLWLYQKWKSHTGCLGKVWFYLVVCRWSSFENSFFLLSQHVLLWVFLSVFSAFWQSLIRQIEHFVSLVEWLLWLLLLIL